ncbi:MAG: HRDC domain-containing protein [Alphaproteobacteria bacterium]|nr:HRDC domain-containing protein [Alphaproteobacteria bacterium]
MFGDTPLHIVEDPSSLAELVAILEAASVIGVDTESNSMYAHTEKVCLIQFSVIGSDWIVDPLAVRDLSSLAPVLADPSIPKVLHGADYDVRCLRRDYDFQIRGLFDTLIAAQMLAMPRVGLADLLDRFFGIEVDKQFQRHDWAQRPLREEHLDYARGDTHWLMALREIFLRKLEAAGRIPHLEEECALMEELEFEPREFDPDDAFTMKGAQGLDDTAMRVLRRLYSFREREAERLDRPPFKVIPNSTLIALARTRPTNDDGLGRHLSKKSSIRRRYGQALLDEIADGVEDTFKVPRKPKPKPKKERRGPPARLRGRAADRAMEALKAWRNDLTDSDPRYTSHNVVSNAVLKSIAAARPRTIAELKDVPDVRNWQAEEFGTPILRVLDDIDPE